MTQTDTSSPSNATSALPLLLAGPFLRHVDCHNVTVMLVTSRACAPQLHLWVNDRPLKLVPKAVAHDIFPLGKKAFLHLLHCQQNELFKPDSTFEYSVSADDEAVYPNVISKVPHTLRAVCHGSCRKIHSTDPDTLPVLDDMLNYDPPDVLFLSGDQVYVDDVAGPTLHAINQIIAVLGLHAETFEDAVVGNSDELAQHPYGYYLREQLLPDTDANELLDKAFFRAKKKPIFTSVNAQNHLMSFAEVCALYLLSFSPTLWRFVEFDPAAVPSEHRDTYREQQQSVEAFVSSLGQVQSALARIPTYMIFDDHDVTDDWNLTRAWEEAVYQHPFSKRIIGNALVNYALFQGIGNQPEQLQPLRKLLKQHLLKTKIKAHDELIDAVFAWEHWHYGLDTQPPVRVLDTRTRRWRSESKANKPSGLMDWEALVDFQQSIVGHDNVIVVSAAPIYGMKFIEMIQRVFTWFGQALTVDAENWMAHKGTANVMLNIFRHLKTPPRFMILSGDVHYSFVYDIRLRFKRHSPQVLQFTCSGIKNRFPDRLLSVFDKLNRIFYTTRSPLNFLTKRRHMKIIERTPDNGEDAEHINPCALGIMRLPEKTDFELSEVECELHTNRHTVIRFQR